MAYKQNPGRGPMMKTGYGVPSALLQEDKKAKVGEVPGYEEIKERFKGKYTVTPKKGKTNEYSLYDKEGHSVSYKAGPKVEDKKMDIADIVNASINKKNK
jgi:hypothetical protein